VESRAAQLVYDCVAGTRTAFDLVADPTALRPVSAAEVPGGRGFDHSFVLCGLNAGRGAAQLPHPPELAAELRHAASGRAMRLFTDAPAVQLYVGGFLDGERGKDGAVYAQHGGLCLETQIHPDAVNQPGFPSPILRPGEEYAHTMVTQLLNDA
jgi:aldose 1-epimerase